MSCTFSNLGKLGRMGNQIWQIAATVGYARQYNIDYILPSWQYAKHFKGYFHQANLLSGYPVYKEKAFHYNKIPRYTSIDLYGYFQSKKYWQHCEAEIKKMFQPNETIQTILDASPIDPNTCAIHVRRTDYLNLQDYHRILPVEYYRAAIEQMKADRYIVFSDDIEACKDMFVGTDNIAYVNSGNDLLDWFMMRQCNHFIIANSSYSWWASYLGEANDKKIIAPRKELWFGEKYRNNNVDDLYQREWNLI